MAEKNYCAIARQYVDEVLSGAIPACEIVKNACQRQLNDLERNDDDWVWFWSEEAANRVCLFMENLRHVKGRWKTTNLTLEPWQCFIITTIFGWVDEQGLRRFKKAYIEVPRKNGKALALDTPIPTPTGWTTMAAVEVGDEVLSDDGLPCKVTATSEIFRDHDCYLLTFSNGETVVADAGHIWVTTARVDKAADQKDRKLPRWGEPSISVHTVGNHKYAYANLHRRQVSLGRADDPAHLQRFEELRAADLAENPVQSSIMRRERTTEEIFKTQRYGKRRDVNHSIDMPAPLDLPEAELSIDPYLLGAWLGDGGSGTSTISAGDKDKDEMARKIRDLGYEVLEYRGRTAWVLQICARELNSEGDTVRVGKASSQNLKRRLRAVGVLGNKHIPSAYLRSSREQRLELLRGLMDTDGTIDAGGRCLSYTTVSKALADGVAELLASLGLKYSVRERPLVCNGRSVPGTNYTLQFMAFRDELPVFSLARKLARMRLRFDCKVEPRSKTVQITDVRKIDTVRTKCIAVDAPSKMYLFGKSMLPTHNTFLAAGIALFMLCADGEPGAEIYSAATTRDQAKVCWDVAQTMVRKDKEMREYYEVEAGAHSITVLDQSAFYKPLSRDSHSLEGLNPHAAIIDELHAHKNREIYDVLNMATGSRSQPLIFVITTAGDDKTGICYEQHTYVVEILEKKFTAESYFGIIYTLDKDSDWTLESSHRMANPNYGISVIPDDISNSSIAAQRAAGAQNTFLTKRLNVWVNVGVAYFNMLAYSKACVTDLTEADFYGEDCIAAVDLASKDDVCCLGKMFRRDDVRYIFVRHYLPSTVAEPGNHPNHHLYSKWAIERPAGFILTPGNITDYEFIEEDLMADSRNFRITSVGFDPYNATEFATRMMKQGIHMVEVPNNVKSFSEPMKLIASLIVSGKLRQNGDPALNWMFGNVRAKIDEKDNVYPKKEKFASKIDGAVTTIMMVAREFAGGTGESVYEKRGLYWT